MRLRATDLFFRQAVGRFVRWQHGIRNQRARLYVPDDPRGRAWAGAFVAPDLGRANPEHVVGVHVNAATMGFIPFGAPDEGELASFTDAEKTRLARLNNFMTDMNGYFQIEATRRWPTD